MVTVCEKVVSSGIDSNRVFTPAIDDKMILSSACNISLISTKKQHLKTERSNSSAWDNDLVEFINAVRECFDSAADEKARAACVRKIRG